MLEAFILHSGQMHCERSSRFSKRMQTAQVFVILGLCVDNDCSMTVLLKIASLIGSLIFLYSLIDKHPL